MIHKDYKKMFNGIIDNNLTQIHNLDEVEGIEGGVIDDRTRRRLESMYKNIREMLNSNLEMKAGEILALGTGVNLSLITLKSNLSRIEKTIRWYNEKLIPAFEQIREAEPLGNDEVVKLFYELFEEPIDEEKNI